MRGGKNLREHAGAFGGHPEAGFADLGETGAALVRELFEIGSPGRHGFAEIRMERICIDGLRICWNWEGDQRKESVVKLLGVTHIGPGIGANLRNGGGV